MRRSPKTTKTHKALLEQLRAAKEEHAKIVSKLDRLERKAEQLDVWIERLRPRALALHYEQDRLVKVLGEYIEHADPYTASFKDPQGGVYHLHVINAESHGGGQLFVTRKSMGHEPYTWSGPTAEVLSQWMQPLREIGGKAAIEKIEKAIAGVNGRPSRRAKRTVAASLPPRRTSP